MLTSKPASSAPEAASARYAQGLATLDAELDDVELSVDGELPAWLEGRLVRNGPGKFEAGQKAFRHWFDGQAMLHRFTFADGRVRYGNRFVDTPNLRSVREGRIGFSEFATDPCSKIFARYFARFSMGRKASDELPGNPVVNVATMEGGQFAITETPIAVRFDPATLATLGFARYQDDLRGQLTCAHPHRIPGTGDLVNYLLNLGPRSEYQLYRQRSGGMSRELVAAVPDRHPGYMHSFAITENYVVLAVYPFVVNPLGLLLRDRPFIENYRWRPGLGTQFIVIGLDDGMVQKLACPQPFFAFHHINAYEAGDGQIVLDLCTYPDPELISAMYLDRLRTVSPRQLAVPTRFHLNLKASSVSWSPLSSVLLELPRISYGRHNGRPYQFVYGAGDHFGDGHDFFDQLVKLDVHSGQTDIWYEPGTYPSEPVFVATPGAEDEDDGIVLSVVLDAATARSFLLVLDAGSWQELARATVPHAIPFGFHGQFTRQS
jgi:carotenoid cleavage dioxygenase-like enzyme